MATKLQEQFGTAVRQARRAKHREVFRNATTVAGVGELCAVRRFNAKRPTGEGRPFA